MSVFRFATLLGHVARSRATILGHRSPEPTIFVGEELAAWREALEGHYVGAQFGLVCGLQNQPAIEASGGCVALEKPGVCRLLGDAPARDVFLPAVQSERLRPETRVSAPTGGTQAATRPTRPPRLLATSLFGDESC